MKNKPVERENYRQKKRKRKSVKKHEFVQTKICAKVKKNLKLKNLKEKSLLLRHKT